MNVETRYERGRPAADPRILVVLGSTREGRFGEAIAAWLMRQLDEVAEADFELADLRDFALPMYEGPTKSGGDDPVAKRWREAVAGADGYIIVTPEYNHGYPASLKNAIDHAYREWNRKPVAFVSYGAHGAGYRAVEQLRQVVVELQMVPIRDQVGIQFPWTAFDADGELLQEGAGEAVGRMVEDLIWWTRALAHARAPEPVAA